MKKISKLSKKKKVMILISSIVVVCGIAIGTMYATGVLPGQTKGLSLNENVLQKNWCVDSNCSCHIHESDSTGDTNTCGHCSKCTSKTK